MSGRPRVLLDLDSTLIDLLTPWLAAYRRLHPDDLVTIADIHQYDTARCVKYPADIWKPLYSPGFYYHLPAYPGALELVQSLVDAHCEVLIATAAMGDPEIAADKIRWVKQHLPFVSPKNIVIGNHKHLMRADAILDDSPHVAEKCRAHWGRQIFVGGIRFPFNAGHADHFDCLAPSWENPQEALGVIHARLADHLGFAQGVK